MDRDGLAEARHQNKIEIVFLGVFQLEIIGAHTDKRQINLHNCGGNIKYHGPCLWMMYKLTFHPYDMLF